MDSLPPEAIPRSPVPKFAEIPSGVEQIRRTLLAGVPSIDILRAAGACRREARRIRWQITAGMHTPEWVPAMEAKVISLTLMEQALASLGGAFREMERREVVCQARQEAEALPAPFVSIGEAAARVVAATAKDGLKEQQNA